MPDTFSIQLEHINAYEFHVKFDLPQVPALKLDELPPLGQTGPNAARILLAAVANCLTASLLYCLEKDNAAANQLNTQASGQLGRDEQGHLRIDQLHVSIQLEDGSLLQNKRLARCLQVFQDYCMVTESVRRGIPVDVTVTNNKGETLLNSSSDS